LTKHPVAPDSDLLYHSLETLRFDNSFVRELPGDPQTENRRRQVLHAAYSRVAPTPVERPELLAHSAEVAQLLGISEGQCQSREFAEVFGGNRLLPGMEPYAACYGGHQFGNWAGQLGDGRAITLGELLGPRANHANGANRADRWELQLKGAGPTPYSRTADGRAVLRSSLREFLCSEAMHHLGVPTTRALSLVSTGEAVVRDMFYDGHPRNEPGAVVCRVAPSFLRFGNFELPTSREDAALLGALADYALRNHFPELGEPGSETYLRWFERVCRSTLAMVVHWMRVGFVHGVMNTDNMSLLGLTIDYGPYGWVDDYDLDWTPNTTDSGGRRYRYGYQPRIALWNLSCFAGALVPLFGRTEPLEEILQAEAAALGPQLQGMMLDKLGLRRADADADARTLAEELPGVLQAGSLDMTLFFRRLAQPLPSDADADARWFEFVADVCYEPERMDASARLGLVSWLRRYARACAQRPQSERASSMNAVNPKYVLRNYLAQLAIDQAEQGDASMIHELLALLRKPYDEQPEHAQRAGKRPDWARSRPGCSMLSCSS
jgi:serine/tyrosine/threonine adenylyltransferase